jgi:hypothetical protein
MPELKRLVSAYGLTAEKIAEICLVSEATARAWLDGIKHAPPLVPRFLRCVYGEENIEDYR